MLSRVAESVFWLNRYMERAENYSRFIDVNYQLSLDLHQVDSQWEPLLHTTGDSETFYERYGEASRGNVIQFLTFDRENPNSIISCMAQARENARTIRENISTEMWEVLNDNYLRIKDIERFDAEGTSGLQRMNDFLQDLRRFCMLFYGTQDSTISHDELFQFALMGRLLERADKTARILDIKYFILLPSTTDVGTAIDLIQWLSLLKSASAHEMYNLNYRKIHPHSIAEFLILNRKFPRAIWFCVDGISTALRKISGSPEGTFLNQAEKKTGLLLSELSYTTIEEIIHAGLHEYIDKSQKKMNELGRCISDAYFLV